ncbi:MAG: hypothetical protein QW680_05345 [Pyrobaculum sp.]
MDSVFSSVPLLGLAFLPIIAYAAYGALMWLIGGSQGREEARRAWARSVVASITVAMALMASVWVGYAVDAYSKTGGRVGSCLSHLSGVAPDLNLYNYAEAVRKALDCAQRKFQGVFNEMKSLYTAVFYTATLTGLFPLTAAFSMGLLQVSMPFSGAASGAFIALGVAKAIAYITAAFVSLMGLGAFLLASERLEALGALILAVSMVYPAALAGAADSLSFSAGVLDVIGSAVNWGKLVDYSGDAAAVAAIIGASLSIATAAVAAATYALTKIPQYFSVE